MTKRIFRVTMLPAGSGDAIWITAGSASEVRHIVVDTGLKGTAASLASHAQRIAEEFQCPTVISLLVLTHIDGDHINSARTFFSMLNAVDVSVAAVWYNGYPQVFGVKTPQLKQRGALGATTAERLSAQLHASGIAVNPMLEEDVALTIETCGQTETLGLQGLGITVLGPTQDRISDLRAAWRTAMKGNPGSAFQQALQQLALGANAVMDSAEANGSSIVLLIEFDGVGLLMTGDAFAPDLAGSLNALPSERRVNLKCVKLPHHGSIRNASTNLYRQLHAQHYLISTNASNFHHPSPETVALILAHHPQATFHFNYAAARDRIANTVPQATLGAVPTQHGITVDLLHM